MRSIRIYLRQKQGKLFLHELLALFSDKMHKHGGHELLALFSDKMHKHGGSDDNQKNDY